MVKRNIMSVYVGRGTEFPSTLDSEFNWKKVVNFLCFDLEIGEIFLNT